MFRFHRAARAAAAPRIATFEIHAAYVGRTPRTAYVTAVTPDDALATAMTNKGRYFHTETEPDYVAITAA